MTNLEELNETELLAILHRSPYNHVRVKRGLPLERLIHLVESAEKPKSSEISKTAETRQRLEEGIKKAWNYVGSQLPCRGCPTTGKCTVHPCSDIRHLECYRTAVLERIVHG